MKRKATSGENDVGWNAALIRETLAQFAQFRKERFVTLDASRASGKLVRQLSSRE
jgi:hypothetical protein